MAGLELEGSNPDVSLLYDINGLAKAAPTWFDRVMEFVGEYGTMFGLVLVGLWCWWSMRKRGSAEDSVTAVAGLVWAPLAAALAVVINIPIRGFVERPRPFNEHEGLEVLIHGKTDYSFVSDHATLAMALAVGIFVANRKFGFVALGLALFAGVSRVYMGVHYPTDVIERIRSRHGHRPAAGTARDGHADPADGGGLPFQTGSAGSSGRRRRTRRTPRSAGTRWESPSHGRAPGVATRGRDLAA
ncbi:hypothetical protein SMICM17S_13106 [Streptomyces microflavus]